MKKNVVMLSVLALLIIGCGQKDKEKKDTVVEEVKKEKIKTVKVNKLEEKEIIKTVISNSELDAIESVEHMTKVGGEIKEINFKNGQKVNKEDLVVLMENDSITMAYKNSKASFDSAKSAYDRSKKFAEQEMRNQLAGAEANLTNASESLKRAKRGADNEEIEQVKSSLESAQKNYEVQETTYERYKKIYAKKLISEIEFLNIENGYKAAESSYQNAKKQLEIVLRGTDKEDLLKLESALKSAQDQYNLAKSYVDDKAWNYEIQSVKSQYESAKAAYEYNKESFDDLAFNARITGVVSGLNLTKSSDIGKDLVIFSIVDDSKIEGTTGVSGSDLSGIEFGKKIKVMVDDLSKTYDAVITEISPSADGVTKKFSIKFEIINDGKIKKGMYGKVYIPTVTKTVLAVPAESVVVRDLASYIFVEKDGRVNRIRIETGISNGNNLEIISDSIKIGDNVVVKGQFLLENNDKVTIVE